MSEYLSDISLFGNLNLSLFRLSDAANIPFSKRLIEVNSAKDDSRGFG